MKVRRNSPCPCCSGRKAKGCCGPTLRDRNAPTPEALMRSRYTAYATGAVEYILATTHPSGPHHNPDTAAWRSDVGRFCDETEFVKLSICTANVSGARGEVHFRADLIQNGIPSVLEERSLFVYQDGRWFYHSALPLL